MSKYAPLVHEQKRFFASGKTLDVAFRLASLQRLQEVIAGRQNDILEALWSDLHKGAFEAHASEIGLVKGELSWFLKRLRRLVKPRRVRSPVYLWPSKSHILPEPYGASLIISPWNYPFQLSLIPLVCAVASGCTVLLKPSERAVHSAALLEALVKETFDPAHVVVVQADPTDAETLLSLPFDILFFTGSKTVGKKIYRAAAEQMIPAVLELGGKNPCLVLSDADIDTAARRIVWGKFFNAGQTCAAPDYVLVDESIKEPLIAAMLRYIEKHYTHTPKQSADLCRLIDETHTKKVAEVISGTIRIGGEVDRADRYISPTILDGVSFDSPVMAEEIFGPVLPILSFSELDAVIEKIRTLDSPLATYVFSENRALAVEVFNRCRFGGGCINDTLLQFTTPYLPVGGMGPSGLGRYHGENGFNAFTHFKTRVTTPRFPAVTLRFPPYTKRAYAFLRFLMR